VPTAVTACTAVRVSVDSWPYVTPLLWQSATAGLWCMKALRSQGLIYTVPQPGYLLANSQLTAASKPTERYGPPSADDVSEMSFG
jgi:hypothetical protein